MKLRRERRLPKLLFILLLFSALMIAMVYVSHQPAPQPDLECHEELVTTMTIQQVSNLFDISLVELTWLPSNLQTAPKITTYPVIYDVHPELSNCQIIIEYPHPDLSRTSNLVSIRSDNLNYLEATKVPASCSWNFTTSGPTGSQCRLDLDGVSTTLRLSMSISSEFDPDTILQILDGVVVVEPQN